MILYCMQWKTIDISSMEISATDDVSESDMKSDDFYSGCDFCFRFFSGRFGISFKAQIRATIKSDENIRILCCKHWSRAKMSLFMSRFFGSYKEPHFEIQPRHDCSTAAVLKHICLCIIVTRIAQFILNVNMPPVYPLWWLNTDRIWSHRITRLVYVVSLSI